MSIFGIKPILLLPCPAMAGVDGVNEISAMHLAEGGAADDESVAPPPSGSGSSYSAQMSSLKDDLQFIWNDREVVNKSLVRMPYEEVDEDPEYKHTSMPARTSQMPLTQRMVAAILGAKARERGVGIGELDVVVPFHGGNAMEVLIWLEAGAKVMAADTNPFAGLKLKRRLMNHGFPEVPENLKIVTPFLSGIPKGDIVTACHPNFHLWDPVPFGNKMRRITRYGMEDSIYIVQADFHESFVDPFVENPEYEVLLHEGIGVALYFFPSWFVPRKRDTQLLIARGRGRDKAMMLR